MAYIGIQRQSVSPTPLVLANLANIDFNTNIPLPNTNADITYAGGTFTFARAGFYLVEWFVVLQSAFTISGPKFTLVATTPGTPATVVNYPSTSSFKTGTLSGSAIVEASVGTTLVLMNGSGAEAVLANNIDVVANITITRAVQELQGVELQLVGSGGGTLINTGTVAYDTVSSPLSSEITNAAGVITVASSGVYVFDWIVSITGNIAPLTEIKFELQDTLAAVVGESVSPAVTQGFITGNAIVLATSGDTFKLVNATGASLMYENVSVQAFMRVFSLV